MSGSAKAVNSAVLLFGLTLAYRRVMSGSRTAGREVVALKRKLLLVEDDSDITALVLCWLSTIGQWDVTAVPDGIQGYAALCAERWDLVVTDVKLPGMNGFAVAGHAKRFQPQSRVLLLTGDARFRMLHSCLSGAFDGVLVKPLNRESLCAMIASLCPQPGLAVVEKQP